MKRNVTNREGGNYARACIAFETSNKTMFGHWVHRQSNDQDTKTYAVYSYGRHFPMYVYCPTTEQWIGNKDKYSRTTTRHQSHCRPNTVSLWVDTRELDGIIERGGLHNQVAAMLA
jgi:SPX domain protein involved in polyphosphate accumulation